MTLDLNPQQKSAVEQLSGPLIISAGPGTGKTKTLVSKILFLIQEKNVSPDKILALTFTKKAANEIKNRIAWQLQKGNTNLFFSNWENNPPFIGTFHSLGFSILSQQNAAEIRIIPENQRQEIIKKVFSNIPKKSLYKSLSTKDLALKISYTKNHSGSAADKKANQSSNQNNLTEEWEQIMADYNAQLKEKQFIDYDDLILVSYQLLMENYPLQKKFQQKFDYILIDEFQDTSPLQYELIMLILNAKRNLFVIGDPFQAIYSFRGASDESFRVFKNDFPDAKEISLELNYRNSRSIIAISHQLFPPAPCLIANDNNPGKICWTLTYNQSTEAEWIVSMINEKLGGLTLQQASQYANHAHSAKNFSDFAIIFRTHEVGRALKIKLRESAIPFQVIGQGSIFEQKEISLIILCLKFLHSGQENFLDELTRITKKFNLQFLIELRKKLHQADEILQTKNLSNLVDVIVTELNIKENLTKKVNCLIDFYEFQNIILSYTDQPRSLESFLNYLETLKQNEYFDQQADKITLLTMHASKGLEFPFVFIAGFENGLIPSTKNQNQEEEKRLLYVALTRAKHEVYLLSAKKRFQDNNRQISTFKKFLAHPAFIEIEDEVIKKIETKINLRKKKEEQLRLF